MTAIANEPAEALAAPPQLTAESRLDFRRAVLEHVERAARLGVQRVVVDLRDTQEIDATGLGVLVLFQKRAGEKRLVAVLRHVPPPVRELLTATRLDALFIVE